MERPKGGYTAKQIDHMMRCAGCSEKMREPKILPCQHTFCLTPCLNGLTDRGSRIIRCPECRAEHVLPKNGVQGFPTNMTVRDLLDMSPQEINDRLNANVCPVCKSEANLAKCLHCDKRLCDQCLSNHCRQLKHEIFRLVTQLRRKIPKVSGTISQTEQKLQDNKMKCEAIKYELSHAIDNHIEELMRVQKDLENGVDNFLESEENSLNSHQESLEAELASVTSFTDSIEGTVQFDVENMSTIDLVDLHQQCSYQMGQLKYLEESQAPGSGQIHILAHNDRLNEAIQSYGSLKIQSKGTPRNGQDNQGFEFSPFNKKGQRRQWSRNKHVSPRQYESPRQHATPRQNGLSMSAVGPRNSNTRTNDPWEHVRNSFDNSWDWENQPLQNGKGNSKNEEPSVPEVPARGFMVFDIPGSRKAKRRPPKIGQGQDRPPNNGQGQDRPPTIMQGQNRPPNIGQGQDRNMIHKRNNQNAHQKMPSAPPAPAGIQRSDTFVKDRSSPIEEKQSSPSKSNSLTVTRSKNKYENKLNAQVIGERGNEVNKFTWPRGVAVFKDANTVAVADSSNHRVQMFDGDGHYISTFGSYGQGDGEFDCLAGICVSGSNRIIISDRYNHRIQIFNRQGKFVAKFGKHGEGDGEFAYPWGVACDAGENIYVCDKENHRIQVFDKNGDFQRKFGKLGKLDAQFDNPHYITITPNKSVVVSDNGNHRLQIFDLLGGHIQSFGRVGIQNGQMKYPRGVAVDEQGFILAADGGNNRIQVFRQDGQFFCSFATHGKGAGQVKGVEGVAIMKNGKVVICDRENHRIQIF